MKDLVSSLFLFLLTFIAVLLLINGVLLLYTSFVPGGKGMIFFDPLIASLFPALVSAVLITLFQFRKLQYHFFKSLLVLVAVIMFILISTLCFYKPAIRNGVEIQSFERETFLSLDNDTKLFCLKNKQPKTQFIEQGVLLDPQSDIHEEKHIQYDVWNKRFIFPDQQGKTLSWDEGSKELKFFGYPDSMKSIIIDTYKIYIKLKDYQEQDLLKFVLVSLAFSLLISGVFFCFTLKTWPLVQWIFCMLVVRIILWFIGYCLWDVNSILSPWVSNSPLKSLSDWLGITLTLLSGMFFILISWLMRPKLRH